MDQTPPGQAPTPSTPQQIEQQLPPPGQAPLPPAPSQPSSSSVPPPTTSVPPSSSSTIPSSPNPNPSPPTTQSQSQQQQQTQPPQQQQQVPSSQNSQTRLPFNRPWQQPSPYPHFSSHLQSMPPPHSSSSSSSSASSSSSPSTPSVPPFSSSAPSTMSAPPTQRGGMAIGVPAHHPSPSPSPTSFSSLNPPSFGQQFGGLARNSANVPDSVNNPSTSQGRQPIQGIQGMGTVGSFGSVPQMRPGGMSGHHQQRPVQSSARPQTTPNTQSSASQNFQGHGMLRVSSAGSPGLSSPSTSQSLQPHNQPWLSSGSQGKPPLPSPPFRPQMNPLSMQQRSHIPQQHQVSTASQQPQASSSQQQQQPSSSHPPQEHYGQQFPPSRIAQSLPHQQQNPRGLGLGNQKPSSHTAVQPSALQAGLPSRTPVSADSGDSCNRILSKRSIQEMVTQIDPSEKLDPEVEDILVEIADEFVESITTFGCSLAKHRKSNTLEAKDILLHLERNWHMTLPGFSGDEIKSYRKPFASDVHRERLAAIKRSIASADTANPRSSAGQGAGNVKGHPPKAPVNIIGSPNPKIREAA